jgi:hypothetical protein
VRALALAGCLVAAQAAARVMPLEPLPDDKLVALAPLLAHGDVALIESHKDGTMKQVTLVLFVKAAPETVHQVIAAPADYKTFVRNVSRSDWEPRESGGVSRWKLDLPVSSFEMANVFRFDAGAAAAVHVTSLEERDDATYRWEMLGAPGGTVLVQYGYTDVKHSNALVRSFLKKMPVTEHGLALAAQLMLAASMRKEAERRTAAGSLPERQKGDGGPGFGFLLERGQVAVIRSTPEGRLSDLSLLDRYYAPLARIGAALADPGKWSTFVPGVDESALHARASGTAEATIKFAIPLVSWTSRYAMRFSERVVEGAATDGDLRGARFRWDLTPRGEKEALVVYRVSQRLTQSSTLFRTLIQHDPSLEHGLTVAFSLVYLRAMRGRAEGW